MLEDEVVALVADDRDDSGEDSEEGEEEANELVVPVLEPALPPLAPADTETDNELGSPPEDALAIEHTLAESLLCTAELACWWCPLLMLLLLL